MNHYFHEHYYAAAFIFEVLTFVIASVTSIAMISIARSLRIVVKDKKK